MRPSGPLGRVKAAWHRGFNGAVPTWRPDLSAAAALRRIGRLQYHWRNRDNNRRNQRHDEPPLDRRG